MGHLDTSTLALVGGVIATIVVQVAAVITLMVNGRNARIQAEEVAARLDERTIRDRKWALEDRSALAATLATKVETTAGIVATKVELTASNLAQKVAEDHAQIWAKVEQATSSASLAITELVDLVKENTILTTEVGRQAEAAYTEANHVNNKISDLNKRLLEQTKSGETIQ